MSMRLRFNWKLVLILNIAGIALAVAGTITVYQVDVIVHHTLYDFSLVFDYEWAIPYWTFERLSLALIGGMGAVNCLSIIYVFMSRRAVPEPEADTASRDRAFSRQREKPSQGEDDGVEVVALPMVCNKCGKVFSQPLCMFDFKSGKPRLVNVCPYCNAVLAVTGNSKFVEK
jgi:uncharacterized Zn-finger protein